MANLLKEGRERRVVARISAMFQRRKQRKDKVQHEIASATRSGESGGSEFQVDEDKTKLTKLKDTSPEDVYMCQIILQSLSQSEIETAARSSYEYFRCVELGSENNCNKAAQKPDNSMRNMYAMKMARRHLVAEKGNINTAIEKIKSTIAFREKMNIDIMRQCFYKFNNEETNNIRHIRKGIEEELSDGKHIVRGHDIDKHAFFIVFPRRYTSFDHDWYLKGKLYSIERAIAYTESISSGEIEKINVVFDYQGYRSDKHEPPLSLIKGLLFCLRDHYPERLQSMYLVDVPFRFRAFWAILKPFIDPVTKSKIQIVNGDEQKQHIFQNLVSPDQAMSFMRKDGLKPDDYDIENWTNIVPFNYDIDWKKSKA